MISVQYPHFAAHPFGMMSESALHSGMPAMPKGTVQAPFGLSAESKAKQAASGAKKRPSRAGTRSVSTLTAAQLERKRANDREAQRAIRQRTKDHIESLERQIRELTATSDTHSKLMQAMQRNQELEQENALLRARLSHAVTTMSEHGEYTFCLLFRFPREAENVHVLDVQPLTYISQVSAAII
jgi:regulator of replication initiation timing